MRKIANAIVNFILPGMAHFLHKGYLIGSIILLFLNVGYFGLLSVTNITIAYLFSFAVLIASAYLGYRLPEKELKSGQLIAGVLLYFVALIVLVSIASSIFAESILQGI